MLFGVSGRRIKTAVGMLILFLPGVVHADDLGDLIFAARTGLVTSLYAKEMCSCHFLSGLEVADCLERDNLNPILHDLISIEVDEIRAEIEVTLSLFGRTVGGILGSKRVVSRMDRALSFLGCGQTTEEVSSELQLQE